MGPLMRGVNCVLSLSLATGAAQPSTKYLPAQARPDAAMPQTGSELVKTLRRQNVEPDPPWLPSLPSCMLDVDPCIFATHA